MNNLLNQLVGLCAGREALLRLERRRLLEEFKSLPNRHEYRDTHLSNHQLSEHVDSSLADLDKIIAQRSFLKPWLEPNLGVKFRRRPHAPRRDESIEAFDPYELLRTHTTPTRTYTEQSQPLQTFTIPPTWSREHKTSFPSVLLAIPSAKYRLNLCKGRQKLAVRVMAAIDNEASNSSRRGDILISTVTDSRRFRIQVTTNHAAPPVDLRSHSTTGPCLDKSEADMRTLSMKLVREMRLRREMILRGPKNRHRIRAEVDAAITSAEALEKARQATAFRADCRLRYQLPEAGRADMQKTACAIKNVRRYHG